MAKTRKLKTRKPKRARPRRSAVRKGGTPEGGVAPPPNLEEAVAKIAVLESELERAKTVTAQVLDTEIERSKQIASEVRDTLEEIRTAGKPYPPR